jgi:hypothetical protein
MRNILAGKRVLIVLDDVVAGVPSICCCPAAHRAPC